MTITYGDQLDRIRTDQLTGFFVGWAVRHAPEKHLAILRNSSHVWLAWDTEADRVVGFVTALTDGMQAAFIPMLEVLPAWQHRGIGSELMRRMLATLGTLPAIDLTCDPAFQPFYEKLGMQRSVGMVIRHYPTQRQPNATPAPVPSA
ncbi:MAG: GNAT family N-acetyltransferase [Opitutales bacterium]